VRTQIRLLPACVELSAKPTEGRWFTAKAI